MEINHLVKNMGNMVVDDLMLMVEPGKSMVSPDRMVLENNEYDYRIPWRDERRGEDQQSRYFCRSAGGKNAWVACRRYRRSIRR